MNDADESLNARLALLIPINNLDPDQREQILRFAEIIDIKKKQYVFRQGERDAWSYYVTEGEVELYADDQLIKRVIGGEGASFHALAQLQPRQMSARAKTKLKVLRVDRGLLDRLLSVEKSPDSLVPEIEVTEIDSAASGHWLTDMLQSELFARMPPSNIHRFLETIESVEFKAGDVVIEQGALGDYYYLIQSGRCEVLRTGKNGKPIKLAELGSGARFGEEALVSNAKRNATVKMLTDGELARLTKADFIELIRTPVMRSCALDEARELVNTGAKWLDVRFPEEHQENGLEASINIPLSNLRSSHQELQREQLYIVYCDTGVRSSAATFLLTQEGFDVSYVEGGAIDEMTEAQRAAAKPPKRQPKSTPAPAATKQEAIVEADIRAQSLAADLEKAKLQIEHAQRIMAEAQTAKHEADRLVAEKMQAERVKMDKRSAAVEARLAEAQRLKDEIERQQLLAAEDATRRHQEQLEQVAALERDAEARLQEEETRIEELYQQQAEKLNNLEREREDSQAEIKRAWDNIETEAALSKERLETAQDLENELSRMEKQRTAELGEKEKIMRASLQVELDVERKKLEAEFARTAEAIERARCDQEAAEAAKMGAAEEAQRIIQEYKDAQDIQLAEQTKKLFEQRRQIEMDGARLKTELEEAAKARAAAEAIKREAENQLASTRQRQNVTDASLTDEIAAIEARARAATERLQNTVAVEHSAANQHRESEERLERTYGTTNEMNLLLQHELDEWVAEQERILGSTQRRHEIEKQLRQTERIKGRAVQAQIDNLRHDTNLLDDIAAQLDAS